jgi:hypothetical protein
MFGVFSSCCAFSEAYSRGAVFINLSSLGSINYLFRYQRRVRWRICYILGVDVIKIFNLIYMDGTYVLSAPKHSKSVPRVCQRVHSLDELNESTLGGLGSQGNSIRGPFMCSLIRAMGS